MTLLSVCLTPRPLLSLLCDLIGLNEVSLVQQDQVPQSCCRTTPDNFTVKLLSLLFNITLHNIFLHLTTTTKKYIYNQTIYSHVEKSSSQVLPVKCTRSNRHQHL